MSLDDDRHPLHEHLRDRDQAQMADLRQFEQEDREARWAEMRQRDATESVEARETYWTGVRRQMPDHVRDTRYQGDAG